LLPRRVREGAVDTGGVVNADGMEQGRGLVRRERGQKEKKVPKLEHTKPGGDSDPSLR